MANVNIKEDAYPIPEDQYNRFKYKLEEYSDKFKERNITLFLLGVATGYRAQDIVCLTIGDIREALLNQKFVIQEQKQYHDWKTHMIKNPKSNKKKPKPREVPIGNNLSRLLKEYVRNKKNSEYAFKSNKGDAYITQKSYSKILSNVGKSLGLKNISGHSMRKTYANRLWEVKKDIEYVRIALGHTNIETTKRYLGLTNGVKEEASEIIDNKL